MGPTVVVTLSRAVLSRRKRSAGPHLMQGLMERSFKNVASIALPVRDKDYKLLMRGRAGKLCSVISIVTICSRILLFYWPWPGSTNIHLPVLSSEAITVKMCSNYVTLICTTLFQTLLFSQEIFIWVCPKNKKIVLKSLQSFMLSVGCSCHGR